MALDAGPLSDLLVLDLTRALAGPHAAMMLGDMGARVIKIEPPTGDDTRSWGPPFVGPDDERESTYFLSANRNKESLVLDLKDEADRDVLARLVERADVLMENYRVGVLDRLGFPVARLHELNPGLVVLSITGFGHDGPEAKRAGYDQIAQGEGGLMSITGTDAADQGRRPDRRPASPGMNGAFGVLAALHERTRTGRGRVVRTSLLAGMVGVHAFQGTRGRWPARCPGLSGDHHPSIAPYGMFATATAPIQIACGSEGLWRALCGAVGLGRRPRPGSPPTRERVAHRDDLIERLESLFADRARRALAGSCSPRPACRRARCARWTTSTRGSRPSPRGCCSSVEHHPGRSTCPARRSASTTSRLRWPPEHVAPRRSASTTSRSGSGWTRRLRRSRRARAALPDGGGPELEGRTCGPCDCAGVGWTVDA